MSGTRVPINEHAQAAQQRRRLPPEAIGPDEQLAPGVSAEAAPARDAPPGRPRRVRKPFGAQEQRLFHPNREGFHRHWFNDEPGRLMRAEEAGYEHVRHEDGKNVSMVVGVARGGGPLTAFLMEIPLEWYAEDMAAQEMAVQERLNQIKTGEYERPAGRDGALRYAGSNRGDISITSSNRR